MSVYKVIMIYPDGDRDEQDEVFSTYEDANEYGCYLVGCSELGAETLEMSNMGDYPMDEYEEPEFEIIEVEED